MLAANQNQLPDLAGIEAFLYREADLLDAGDLHSWRELFTEDGTYWMPVAVDQPDPLNHISIIYEDRLMMAIRAEMIMFHPANDSPNTRSAASVHDGGTEASSC